MILLDSHPHLDQTVDMMNRTAVATTRLLLCNENGEVEYCQEIPTAMVKRHVVVHQTPNVPIGGTLKPDAPTLAYGLVIVMPTNYQSRPAPSETALFVR